jgi:hypothetical protein
MAHHVCSIVPPYLLEGMANSQDPGARELAAKTLAITRQVHENRYDFSAARLAQGHHGHDGPGAPPSQSIVPDYLLEHISKAEGVDDSVKESALKTLALSQQIRDARTGALAAEAPAAAADTGVNFWRGVYNMEHHGDRNPNLMDQATKDLLPGKAVRVEGQPASQDNSANEAYDNCGKVLDFYKSVLKYKSLDDKNMPVISSVHYANGMGNAFWYSDNTIGKHQMIYGDGDNEILYNFTACIDVIGHEMTVSSPCFYRLEPGYHN